MIATMNIKTLRTLSLIAFLAIFNSACTVLGPDYKRPAVDVPDEYKEIPEVVTQSTREQTADTPWWTVYQDQELDKLLTQVENKNYSIQAIEARVRQARAVANIARAAKSPSIAAGGTNDLGIAAKWEVDLWGKVQRNIEASEAIAKASIADLAAAKLALQAQIAQNYFLLRVQDADLEVLKESIESYERSLQITQNQYAAGVVNRSDVAQAQSQLSITKVTWHKARLTRAKLEHSIAVLIGKTPADFSIAQASGQLRVPDVPSVLPAELLERRPDVVAAEQRLAAASAKIGVAESAAYPSLDIFAGVTINKGLIGGVKTAVPIYTAGAVEEIQTKALANYDEAVANYRQTVLTGLREVEDSLVTLKILDTATTEQEKAIEAADEAVKTMSNQYKSGVVNFQSIIIVQAIALTNQRGALDILRNRLTASVNLIKSLGGGWQSSTIEEKAP